MSDPKHPGASGGGAEASPLSVVYPGEYVQLSVRAEPVLVRPWGVKALLHEIPAMFAGIMAKLAPSLKSLKGGTFSVEVVVPVLISQAGTELLTFIAWTAKLTPDEVESLSMTEFTKLLRAVVRQNQDFFEQLRGLYGDLGRPVDGLLSNLSAGEPRPKEETAATG